MINAELEHYITKYVRLNKKVYQSIEYIKLIKKELLKSPENEAVNRFIEILNILEVTLNEEL